MFELKTVWVSFSKPCQDTAKASQNSITAKLFISFGTYVHTYPCNIIYIHSVHSKTLLHIQTPSPCHFYCTTTTKKATEHPYFLGSTHRTFITVRFPCDRSDSTSSCGNRDGGFMTHFFSEVSQGFHPFPAQRGWTQCHRDFII